jgi:hypothetical protein
VSWCCALGGVSVLTRKDIDIINEVEFAHLCVSRDFTLQGLIG